MFGNAHKLPHKDITVEYGDVWYTVAWWVALYSVPGMCGYTPCLLY